MNKSTEQALTSLLPTLNGAIPTSLLNLSTSLLAQSRSNASALKPDEEIARSYVCAHIACERLKQSLNLPKIDARPPCPPRVYSKLFGYIDQVLLARIPGAATPTRKRRTEPQTPSRWNDGPVTPRRSSANANAKSKATSASTLGKRVRSADDEITEDGVPGWVMPLVRHVCLSLSAPAAVPHIYAGVCSILRLLHQHQLTASRKVPRRSASESTTKGAVCKETGKSIENEQIPALVVTVALYTLTRLRSSEEVDLDGEAYLALREKAVSAVRGMDRGRLTSQQDMYTDVEMFVRRAVKEGWLEGEWFANIPEGGGLEASRDWVGGEGEELAGEGQQDHSDMETGVEEAFVVPARTPLKRRLLSAEDDGGGRLQCGLGTMMQDRVDWLSEERRREFKVWKRGIMRRIEEIERTGEGSGGMEISGDAS